MDVDFNKYASLLSLADFENSNACTENEIGALGAYQFLPETLNSLRDVYNLPEWQSNFLCNIDLQNIYLKALVNETTYLIIINGLNQYIGQTVTGAGRFNNITTKINIYGLLAGAHLGGFGNLRKFLEYGQDFSDSNNTFISDYIAKMSSLTQDQSKDFFLNKKSGLEGIALLSLFILFLITGGNND